MAKIPLTKKKGRPKGAVNKKGRKPVGKYGFALIKDNKPYCPECQTALAPPAIEYDTDFESDLIWFAYTCTNCKRVVKVYTNQVAIGEKRIYPEYKKQVVEKPFKFVLKKG